MTESQIVNLVLRHQERTGRWPDEITAHPNTILNLVLSHALPLWDEIRSRHVVLTVMGVPVVPNALARRGTLYIRRTPMVPYTTVTHVTALHSSRKPFTGPRGVPCS